MATAAEGATSLSVVVKVIGGAAKTCQMPSHQKLDPFSSLYPILAPFPNYQHSPRPLLPFSVSTLKRHLLLLLSNLGTQGQ